PRGDPSQPAPPPIKRYAGEFSRWNLEDLPDKWDPEIARLLHEYFELIDRDKYRGDDVTEIQKIRAQLQKYLASLGPEAIPTLGKILNVEPSYISRRDLLVAIGNLGPRSEEATWILRDYYFAIREDPSSRSEMGHVIKAMGSLKNENSFEVLEWLAKNDEHRTYRDKVMTALSDHPRGAEAVPVFEGGLKDANFHVRNKAAQALKKVGDTEILDVLMDRFEKERVHWARQTILGAIGRIGDSDVIPFLEEQARSAKTDLVRLSAAGAIRRIVQRTGDRYGARVLKSLARSETNDTIRVRIERWASQL
ncbi:MAG: HEAT repeat domain-containing protein, partial [Planctomycetota bacterium]